MTAVGRTMYTDVDEDAQVYRCATCGARYLVCGVSHWAFRTAKGRVTRQSDTQLGMRAYLLRCGGIHLNDLTWVRSRVRADKVRHAVAAYRLGGHAALATLGLFGQDWELAGDQRGGYF